MRVIFFGRIAELIGAEVVFDDAPETVAALREALAARFPHARDALMRPSLRACVADALVADDHPLAGIDTVEFFPPVSGG